MYCEYFGLTAKPFRLSPDAAFFYPSSEHRRALAFLEYGLDQADGFIVITGDVGTGKTTLVQALLQDLDPDQVLVATVVTTHLKEDDLLHWVASRFGIEAAGQGKAVILQELERLLTRHASAGRRALLIVDEAQNLTRAAVEELRMLSNFQIRGRPLLQVFLVGQEEFRTTLLSDGFEQLRQRVIATYHLNPLGEEETRTYIEHRLSRVDWRQDPAFSDAAFAAIHRYCDGVPRRINNLCDRLLLFAYLEELHAIDDDQVRTVAEEIGEEFNAGVPKVPEPASAAPAPGQTAEQTGQPLEAMARVMFDKANVQQRLATLERAVDALGQGVRADMSTVKEELAYIRNLLEFLRAELSRQRSAQPPGPLQRIQ